MFIFVLSCKIYLESYSVDLVREVFFCFSSFISPLRDLICDWLSILYLFATSSRLL